MPDILLIPTSLERNLIERSLRRRLGSRPATQLPWKIELCGFGLVAAGIATARAIAHHRPQRILLIGIAGALQQSPPIGSACRFDQVTCHGIGVGSTLTDHHRSAGDMGWAQCEACEQQAAIGDRIVIDPQLLASGAPGGHLLSVTTASANEAEADQRRRRFPDAVAEDMEGFAVAMACQLADIPLQIIRGLSNRAGNRDRDHWRTEQALDAALEIAWPCPGNDR